METRFTFKDFVFTILFLLVIAAVIWTSSQFGYQEQRLNDVKTELARLNDSQKSQLAVLDDIRATLKKGLVVSSTQAGDNVANADGHIRRKNPDGSLYVYYPTPPRPPHDPNAAPDYSTGDWLIRNLGEEPKLIAPFIEKDYYGAQAHEPVLESLIGRNSDTFEYEPILAESYEQSADGLHFKFVLRKNLAFSDGHPLTADDVVFSFKTIMTDGVDCAPLRSFYSNIASCTKIDSRTIEFVYTKPYFDALGVCGGLNVIPQHIYKFDKPDEFNRRGDILIGSGPYIVQSWDRGRQLVYVRNERYWGEKATFDKIVMKFIKNPQAAFQALQNGELDSDGPDPDQWVKFSNDPEFLKHFTVRKFARVDSGYAYIGYNEEKPMFKDKETRQALTMLVDRKAIIHTIYRDLANETTGPFNPLSLQYDHSIQPWPYDPDAAKAKLAKAGWRPGPDGILVRDGIRFEFDLSFGTGNPTTERVANYVQSQFKLAGINMRITPSEFSVLVERLDDRKFDAVTMGWSGGIEEDPYQIWHSDSIPDKGSNFIQFRNKESDALIEEARRTVDEATRMVLWHKWHALINEEQPYTFLQTPMSRAFIDNRFKNTEPYKTGLAPYDWYVPGNRQKYH